MHKLHKNNQHHTRLCLLRVAGQIRVISKSMRSQYKCTMQCVITHYLILGKAHVRIYWQDMGNVELRKPRHAP